MSAHTLWWVLSRGSARWCEALGARTTALSPAPQPGTRAGGPPAPAPPPASPKKKEKKKGKKATGGGGGGGAGAGSRKFPRRKFHGTGRGVSSPVPAPPPRKLSGNYFQPPRALLTLSSTSRRTKPFLGKARGRSLGRGKGSREALSHCLLPDPLGTTEVMGVTPGQRAAWGSGRVAAAGTSTSENAACPRMDPRIYI